MPVAGCDGQHHNFSQYPGFSAYFLAHPPARSRASPEEQELLRRYRPRLFLPAGPSGPVDFFADYIAYGRLTDGAGRLVSTKVTREILNAHKHDPGAVFVHEAGGRPTTPTMYGRVDRETVTFETDAGNVTEPFTFLTYHAVFPTSGLPAGLPAWKAAVLHLVASLEDWHQLDHYTAATVVLDRHLEPVALMLQQHNYLHTYLLGTDLPLPADGRAQIDVAIRSNELYPHSRGRTLPRAVAMSDPAAIRYLISGGGAPFLAADDITESAREAEYTVGFLPPDDAFYRFQGFLGERRWLPGRSGPPGADYNTLPALKPRAVQMLTFYWREGDPGDLARFDACLRTEAPLAEFARAQAPIFYQNWRAAGAAHRP